MKKLSVVVLVLLLVSMVAYGYAPGHWEDDSQLPEAWTTGRLGIGTTSPYCALHVQYPECGPRSYWKQSVIYGYNTATGYDPVGVCGRVNSDHGRAIYGYNQNSNGYGGYFEGKGYFSGEVSIGSKLEVNDDIKVEAGPDDDDADIILTDATGKFGWIAQDKLSGAMWVEHAEGQKLMLSGQYGAEGTVVVKGVLGVGTDDPQSELAVNGTVTAKEVIVTTDGWPDFVFADNYNLMPLYKLEKHIKANKSLPGIPTEKEVLKDGVEVGKMQAKLLEKVEELTLYTISQEKRLSQLEKENEELKNANKTLERRIYALEN